MPLFRLLITRVFAVIAPICLPLVAQESVVDATDPGFAQTVGNANTTPVVQRTASGPWGDLEYYQLNLEPPLDYLVLSPCWDARQFPTTWRFLHHDPAEVRAILTGAELDAATVDGLMATAVIDVGANHVEIRPPDEVVLSLKGNIREQLYSQFVDPGSSDPFSEPLSISADGFAAMATGSRLPQPTIDLISALTYSRSNMRLFSDISLVMQRQPDEDSMRLILSTLLRQRSLNARLRLSETANFKAIAEYWSAGGRSKDFLPMLESINTTDGVETLDIVHLLPPTPRKLLNTFARPLMSMGTLFPDCFWTALNFFSFEPSDRYLGRDRFGDWLNDQYDEVQKPLRVGDIVLVIDMANQKPIHACNYVAADIVFTKNGLSLMKPWVLQPLDEVLSFYRTDESIGVIYFRKRP
ncbi:MAG TPA: hypothetical protein PK529_06930 [Verrucomicrobiales bacterium]|nr:hypothetical protein [Verrucomicrobiales bacterium]